jgi:hypothetical protein
MFTVSFENSVQASRQLANRNLILIKDESTTTTYGSTSKTAIALIEKSSFEATEDRHG